MLDFITVNLVSGFVEFTLFGIFVVLSSASLVLLLRRHRTVYGASHDSNEHTPRWRVLAAKMWGLRRSPLILANILLMLTITMHFGFSAERLVLAMVNEDGGRRSIVLLIDLRERTQVARLILLVIAMFIGDVVITYRVWIVWGKNYWITIFPILTVVGVIVAGSGMIHQFTVSHSDTGVFTAAVGPWITATCVMTVCTNVYGTLVIAYRVWSSNRFLRNTGVLEGGRSLLDSVAIFVESAALWTFWVILYLVWYLTGSTLETIGSGTGPVVIGITFALITVRVGLGWGQETKTVTASMRWAHATSSVGLSHERQRRPVAGGRGDPARPQAISLTVMHGAHDRDDALGVDAKQGSVDIRKPKLDSLSLPKHSEGTFGGGV